MKLKKILIAAAFVIISAVALSTAASADETATDANGQPIVTTPASDVLNANVALTTTVPSINLNIQAAMPTAAVTGAVLGNSTPEDSASTGDSGVTAAVAVMVAAAGVGSVAAAMKFRKK